MVLAEYESDIEELKKMLALYNIVIEQAITIGCDRITILKRKENIQPAFQNKYCSMQIIDDMYLLVCLHLPSKLYADELNNKEDSGYIYTIDSKTEFEELLVSVFNSKTMQKIIQNLITASNRKLLEQKEAQEDC